MMEDLMRVVEDKLTEALKQLGHLNIVIAGRTGVGKSTLINAVFQGNMAETGQGRPVTQDIREITKQGIPLTILDTRGLEVECYKKMLADLEREVSARNQSDDPLRHVHLAWLCIHEDGRRVEEGESKVAEMLAKYAPVLAVVTKARADNGFRAEVQKLIPIARNVVRVRAIGDVFDDGQTLLPMGLDKLVEATWELLPEARRTAFAAAQKVCVQSKVNRAHAVVAASAAAAAGAAAVPLPFSDAVALVPIQVSMLAGVTAAFGFPLSKAFITSLIGSATTALGATLVGRLVFTSLVKLIPGAGSVIAAGVAASITVAFGETYISVLRVLYEKHNGEPPTEAEIRDAFLTGLREKMTKAGNA